ncbi:MAG: hypothetical protein HY903_03345 [Deltaproteobacteria bacterium]|nr:hypothetical protein [Deltaproteobacteria bacterium]
MAKVGENPTVPSDLPVGAGGSSPPPAAPPKVDSTAQPLEASPPPPPADPSRLTAVPNAGVAEATAALAPERGDANAGGAAAVGPLLAGVVGVTLGADGAWQVAGVVGDQDKHRDAALATLYRAATGGTPVFDDVTDRRAALTLRGRLVATYRALAVPAPTDHAPTAADRRRDHLRAASLHLIGELAKRQDAIGDATGAGQTLAELYQMAQKDPEPRLVQFVFNVLTASRTIVKYEAGRQMRELLFPSRPPERWFADGKLDLVVYIDDNAVTLEAIEFFLTRQSGLPRGVARDVKLKRHGDDAPFPFEVSLTLPGKDGKRVPVTLRVANPLTTRWFEHLGKTDIVTSFGHGVFGSELRRALEERAPDADLESGLWAFQCWGLTSYELLKSRWPRVHFLATTEATDNTHHMRAFWTALAGVAKREPWRQVSEEIQGALSSSDQKARYVTPDEPELLMPRADRDRDGLQDNEDLLYQPVLHQISSAAPGLDPVDHDVDPVELPGEALQRAVTSLGMLMAEAYVGRTREGGWVLDGDLFSAGGYAHPPADSKQAFEFAVREVDGRKHVNVRLNPRYAHAGERTLGKMLAVESARFLGRELGLTTIDTEALTLAMLLRALVVQGRAPIRSPLEEPDVEMALLAVRYGLPALDWRTEVERLPRRWQPDTFAAFRARMQAEGMLGFGVTTARPVAEPLPLATPLESWARFGWTAPSSPATAMAATAGAAWEPMGQIERSYEVEDQTAPQSLRQGYGRPQGEVAVGNYRGQLAMVVQAAVDSREVVVVSGLPARLTLQQHTVRGDGAPLDAATLLGFRDPAVASAVPLRQVVAELEHVFGAQSPIPHDAYSLLPPGTSLAAGGLFAGADEEPFRFESQKSGGRTTVTVSLNRRLGRLDTYTLERLLRFELAMFFVRAGAREAAAMLAVNLPLVLPREFSSLEEQLAYGTLLARHGLADLERTDPYATKDVTRARLRQRRVRPRSPPLSVSREVPTTAALRQAWRQAAEPAPGLHDSAPAGSQLTKLAAGIAGLENARLLTYLRRDDVLTAFFATAAGQSRVLLLSTDANGDLVRATLLEVPVAVEADRDTSLEAPPEGAYRSPEVEPSPQPERPSLEDTAASDEISFVGLHRALLAAAGLKPDDAALGPAIVLEPGKFRLPSARDHEAAADVLDRLLSDLERPPLALVGIVLGQGTVTAIGRRADGRQVVVHVVHGADGYARRAKVVPAPPGLWQELSMVPALEPLTLPPVLYNPPRRLKPEHGGHSDPSGIVDLFERARYQVGAAVTIEEGPGFRAADDDLRLAQIEVQGPAGAETVTVHPTDRYPRVDGRLQPAADFELTAAVLAARGVPEDELGWRALFAAVRGGSRVEAEETVILLGLRYGLGQETIGKLMVWMQRRARDYDSFVRDVVRNARSRPRTTPAAVGRLVSPGDRPKVAEVELSTDGYGRPRVKVDGSATRALVARLKGFERDEVTLVRYDFAGPLGDAIQVRTRAPDGRIGWLALYVDLGGRVDHVAELMR